MQTGSECLQQNRKEKNERKGKHYATQKIEKKGKGGTKKRRRSTMKQKRKKKKNYETMKTGSEGQRHIQKERRREGTPKTGRCWKCCKALNKNKCCCHRTEQEIRCC